MKTLAEQIREKNIRLTEEKNALANNLPKFVKGEANFHMTLEGGLSVESECMMNPSETQLFVEWILRNFVRKDVQAP